MQVECNECGASDWSKMQENDYPERRRERDRTVEKIYRCTQCGNEGKRFVHNNGGPDILSGAMR